MKNNWINVKDRLPKDTDEEIPMILSQGPNSESYVGIWLYDAFYDIDGKVEQIGTKYWQPLPEAPNKKSVGNQEDGMIDGISDRTIEALKTLHSDLEVDYDSLNEKDQEKISEAVEMCENISQDYWMYKRV